MTLASLCWMCLGIAPAAADPAASDPEAVLRQIRSATLDTAHPLDPSGLRLSTGFATLDLASGLLIPARTAGGRAVEMVFLGRGRVRLEPPDDIEDRPARSSSPAARAWRRASPKPSSSSPAIRGGRGAAASGRRPADLETRNPANGRADRYREVEGTAPERRTLGVETGILLDALNDPLYEDYFAGWFLGADLGALPAADRSGSGGAGQPRPVRACRRDAGRDGKASARYLHRQQKSGRLVGLEMENIGRWDSWIHTGLRCARTTAGRPPGSPGFEPTPLRAST